MEYSTEFIKYITEYRKLEIIKLPKGYLTKCGDYAAKGANIETALMLLVIRMKEVLK